MKTIYAAVQVPDDFVSIDRMDILCCTARGTRSWDIGAEFSIIEPPAQADDDTHSNRERALKEVEAWPQWKREVLLTKYSKLPAQANGYERCHAVKEGERNAAEREYFEARPQADTGHNRHLFCAGFDRGFDKATQPGETTQLRARIAELEAGVEVTDAMAHAFHHALTDGSIGNDDLEEIKNGLRAVFEQFKPAVAGEIGRVDEGAEKTVSDDPFGYFHMVDGMERPDYWRSCHKHTPGAIRLYTAAPQAPAIAAQEISRLRGWIADEGARSDICTWGALGEVCAGCRCKNAPKQPEEADSDGYTREDEDWFFSPNDGD